MTMTETNRTGCPRHPMEFNRSCRDIRCMRKWSPKDAPSPDEQLARWVEGDAVCPNSDHECCPDFGCCHPKLLWPKKRRLKYMAASQKDREKMTLGSLGDLIESTGARVIGADTPGRHSRK